jgi:hypothetical protein
MSDSVLEMSFIIYNVVIPTIDDRSLLSLELGEALFPLQMICFKNIRPINRTFRYLAERGALKLLQKFHPHTQTGFRYYDSTEIREVFIACCALGHLEVARWLHAVFHLTREDALYSDRGNSALVASCANGQMHMLRWLHATFTLPLDDTLYGGKDALKASCKNGHLEVSRWLNDTFNLDIYDLSEYISILQTTCKHGHIEIVRWLQDTFELTADDVRSDNNYALRESCAHGHLDVAKWLCKTFQLTSDDANDALPWCSHNTHPEIVRWLRDTFRLTDS